MKFSDNINPAAKKQETLPVLLPIVGVTLRPISGLSRKRGSAAGFSVAKRPHRVRLSAGYDLNPGSAGARVGENAGGGLAVYPPSTASLSFMGLGAQNGSEFYLQLNAIVEAVIRVSSLTLN